MASAWRVPLTPVHIKGRDVLEQMSGSAGDTWVTAHLTACRKVCREVSISSNAAEAPKPHCEIMFSCYVLFRITATDTRTHAGRSTVWPFDLRSTCRPSVHSSPVNRVSEEKERRNRAISVGKHKHFSCHALSISRLAGFSEQVISVIQSLHRRSRPPWNGIAAKQTLILSTTEIRLSSPLLLLVLGISARASWNQYSSPSCVSPRNAPHIRVLGIFPALKKVRGHRTCPGHTWNATVKAELEANRPFYNH